MLVLVIGAGRVGSSVATSALRAGHTVSVLDEDPLSHERLDVDLVVAVTGDDEDNLLICQVAKEKYLCERIIARVNNPRNLEHFKLLGIQPAVSATDLILRLIEHEVPRYGLVHLLDLPEERLEIIEIEVGEGAPAAGQKVADVTLPDGALIISVLRNGGGFVPKADTIIEAGDEVLLVLDPGLEDHVTPQFT